MVPFPQVNSQRHTNAITLTDTPFARLSPVLERVAPASELAFALQLLALPSLTIPNSFPLDTVTIDG